MSPGIYIHIPFCLKKCGYCDFVSSCPEIIPEEEYARSVIKEIRTVTESLYNERVSLKSIYFGGGTPSLLSPENIYGIISDIKRLYDLEENAEITLEANPKTAGYDKLKEFKSAGINRLSIGIQSFNDKMLKMLGRVHDGKDALNIYDNSRKAGFENINLDIIFGIPGQTGMMLKDDLKTFCGLNPEHISAYILTLEKNVPMYKKIGNGRLPTLPKDDETADMFNIVEGFLTDNSYTHYEISAYAREKKESVHNLNYWRYGEYLGFGAAAHSLIKDNDSAKDFFNAHGTIRHNTVRWNNVKDHEEYMKRIKREGKAFLEVEPLDEKKRMTEFLIMGLRLLDGIRCSDFKKEFKKEIFDVYDQKIKLLSKRELIEIKNNSLKLTKKGVLLSNEVLINLI
jgi:oxygen-independent coproporphyrinogen-3 oxidase